jgi:hypothetical protein
MEKIMVRPPGALNLADLQDLLALAKMEKVILYKVYGLGKASSIGIIELDERSLIKEHKYDSGDSSQFLHYYRTNSFTSIDFSTSASIVDANVIENGYNDHYWFSNKLIAERYLNLCRNSARLECNTQRHWEDCRRWEDSFDDNWEDYED